MKNIEKIIQGMSIEHMEKQTKVLYPRQELIKKFVDRLNIEREGTKYKKLDPKFVAIKMYQSGLKSDFLLNWFFGYCNDAKHFSKCWFWSMNHKSKVMHT